MNSWRDFYTDARAARENPFHLRQGFVATSRARRLAASFKLMVGIFFRRMIVMRWVHWSAGCLLVLALAGCAAPGVVTHAGPIATGIPVSLDFILLETSSSLNDAQAEQQSLNELTLSSLRQTGIFGLVTGNRAEVNGGGMEVRADIKEIKRVSPGDRTWFGGLAGHARVMVQVTVSDLNSRRQIQTFEINSESGASSRAGTTGAALQLAAQSIAAQTVAISRQTSD
jgi:hypothetical protein